LKTTLNLLIVLSLLAFTLACGLTGDSDGGNKNASAETEKTQTDDGTGQDAQEDNGQADDDSATDEDASGKGEDKSVTVKFAKGSTSRSYSDEVFSGYKHVYTFGVAQDQRITVRIASRDDGAYLKIFDPSGDPVRLSGNKDRFSESVAESGNYRIEVLTSTEASEYTVGFSASALPSDDGDIGSGGTTVAVRFGKGKSSASYNSAVIRGERDVYELRANGGQQMSVSITSEEDNAVFQIEGPGGYLPGAGEGSDRTSWSGELPANGTYRVIVGGTRGNATYTVTISIR